MGLLRYGWADEGWWLDRLVRGLSVLWKLYAFSYSIMPPFHVNSFCFYNNITLYTQWKGELSKEFSLGVRGVERMSLNYSSSWVRATDRNALRQTDRTGSSEKYVGLWWCSKQSCAVRRICFKSIMFSLSLFKLPPCSADVWAPQLMGHVNPAN